MNRLMKSLTVFVVAASAALSIAAQEAPIFTPNEPVNVRSAPSLTASVRAVVDDALVITGRSGDFDASAPCRGGLETEPYRNRWLRVTFAQGEGWVWRCAGQVDGDTANLPVVEAAVPAVARADAPAALSGNLVPQGADGLLGTVTAAVANVRQAPTIRSERIGRLRAAAEGEVPTQVLVTGSAAGGNWAQVQYQSGDEVVTGFMARFLLLLPRDWQERVPAVE